MRKNFAILCDEQEFPRESVERMEKALHGLVKSDVLLCFEVEFVDEEQIRELNRTTREIDRVTDVLSYPALDGIVGHLCHTRSINEISDWYVYHTVDTSARHALHF